MVSWTILGAGKAGFLDIKERNDIYYYLTGDITSYPLLCAVFSTLSILSKVYRFGQVRLGLTRLFPLRSVCAFPLRILYTLYNRAIYVSLVPKFPSQKNNEPAPRPGVAPSTWCDATAFLCIIGVSHSGEEECHPSLYHHYVLANT